MLQKSDHLQVMVAFLLRLSDSFRLSDKQWSNRSAVVRFFAVIGQEMIQSACGCPILSGYRTRSGPVGIWLSDSFRLSDKQLSNRSAVVRFFALIGQAMIQSAFGCPILRG